MKSIGIISLWLLAASIAVAGDQTIISEDASDVFTGEQLVPSTTATSSSPILVNRSNAVIFEVNVDPPLTGGATLVLEPLYMLDEDGTNAGYALPLDPTDSQTISSGGNMMIVVYPPEGVYSMYLGATASTTENVTIQGRPR